jgi:hypothetical protein
MNAFKSIAIFSILIVFITFCLVPSFVLAAQYEVPGHGNLYLNIPSEWADEVNSPNEALPPTIILTPESGDDFRILITPLWHAEGDPDFNSKNNLKSAVTIEGEKALEQSVESELKVKEIKGEQAYGYYFMLTDKSLVGKERSAGNYKYLLNSFIGVGDLLVLVTALYHEPDDMFKDRVIDMLEGIKLKQ